jgi:hypothetical protein
MSSYLLDTTSNSSVTYGQGKYVASASSEFSTSYSWQAFNKVAHTGGTTEWSSATVYSSAALYTGSVTTVDALGISYAGEWLQIQMPVSVILSSYSLQPSSDAATSQSPAKWWILGSRDGLNWSLVDSRSGVTSWTNSGTQTFTASATQAYNYFRLVTSQVNGNGTLVAIAEWILNGLEESLCITSDSKVGVGIANPQRALEVAGDLVVGGTISGGAGMGGFRNRIINGDMRIAQRGTSATVTYSGFTTTPYYQLDRWGFIVGVGTFTVSQQTLVASDAPYQLGFSNSIRVTSNPGTSVLYIEPSQKPEGYMTQDFNWGTSFGVPVTFSFWFRSLCTPGSVFVVNLRPSGYTQTYITQFTITNSNTWQYYTVTVPPPPNGTSVGTGTNASMQISIGAVDFRSGGLTTSTINSWVAGNYICSTGTTNILATAGNYIEFTGVQLEKGTVATPFEFRNYATELALCQRYYYRLTSATGANYMVFGTGSFIGSTTVAQVYIPFPITMRAAAAIANFSNSAPSTFWFGALGQPATAITQVGGTEGLNGSQVAFTQAATVTAGVGAIIEANNSYNTFLAFNAEL